MKSTRLAVAVPGIILMSLLLFLGVLAGPGPVLAQVGTTVEFNPTPLVLAPGASGSVDVVVNNFTDTDGLGAYDVIIGFDPTVVTIASTSAGDFPFGGPICAPIPSTTGQVACTNFQAAQFPGPTGDQKIFGLGITAVGAGGTSLDITITSLTDVDGADIAATPVNGQVVIEPAPVTVPDVVGLTQGDAETAIEAAGLVVGAVTTASDPSVPAGSVISQAPAAGELAALGSAVDLVVSTGPGNTPPVANDDSATTDEDTAVTVDVLDNDTDVDDAVDSTSVVIVTDPANGGTAVDANTGEVTYTPNADFNGTDTFAYTVADDLGATSNEATVSITVTPINDAPVANAGDPQTVRAGETVTLNGSGSTDVDDEDEVLTFAWTLTSVPANSTATLSEATAVSPTFVADLVGEYVAQLVVSDDEPLDSESATVTITVIPNAIPVANAGPDQNVEVGETVTLVGSGSDDDSEDTLTFGWTLVTPEGSAAELSDETAESPTFVADLLGDYVATLIVNDGIENSVADTVTVHAVDLVIGLPHPGQFAVVSAPTLLSRAPTLVQDNPNGASQFLVQANGQFLLIGETGFDEIVKPVSAFYVFASSNGSLGFTFAAIAAGGQSTKSLTAGWNLLGTNSPGTAVNELSQIQNTTTTAGMVTLHVPNGANGNKDFGHTDWGIDGDQDRNANPISALPNRNLSEWDGYWVFMNAPRSYSKLLGEIAVPQSE